MRYTEGADPGRRWDYGPRVRAAPLQGAGLYLPLRGRPGGVVDLVEKSGPRYERTRVGGEEVAALIPEPAAAA